MKIFLLADANSAHTLKWCKALASKGIELSLFSITDYDKINYRDIKSLKIDSLALSKKYNVLKGGAFSKVIYLTALPKIKKIISEFKPDILHAHYATSYGLLGALSKFHPYIISVWGSDVYNFPQKNFLNKKLVKYNLGSADVILSTSKTMALETKKYTSKNIDITPFGIDVKEFFSAKKVNNKKEIVIGTVKTLEKKYGIEFLIKSFALLKKKYPAIPIKLLIVGGGTMLDRLQSLTKKLNIESLTTFTGRVPYKDVSKYHRMIDIFAALSVEDSESFGVSVLEASASENPVIVSDVGGLPEVVKNDVTGFVVSKKNIDETVFAVEKLILNQKLREKMGENGRKHVIEHYSLDKSVKLMIDIYKKTIPNSL